MLAIETNMRTLKFQRKIKTKIRMAYRKFAVGVPKLCYYHIAADDGFNSTQD